MKHGDLDEPLRAHIFIRPSLLVPSTSEIIRIKVPTAVAARRTPI